MEVTHLQNSEMALIDIKFDGLFKNLMEALGGVFKKKKAQDAVIESILIRNISKGIVQNGALAVDCFLVMMVHNGGKKLMPHSFKYRSIVNGYHNSMQLSRFAPEEYRFLELDAEYELLIYNLCKKKEIDIVVSTLGDSKLSVKLKFEGLQFARFFYLYDNADSIWYAIAGTTSYNEYFDTITHKHEFTIALNKIKNMIKKY